MARFPSALRATVLYGLLSAAGADAVSPTAQPIRQRAPHVVTDVANPNPTSISAVSECHFHGTVQYCQAGTSEYRISGSATASSYTDCHPHGADVYCMAPTGEVLIVGAQAAQTDAPTPTQADAVPSSITAVSECHTHESALFCMVGTAEYEVHTTVTATQDIPPAFTGCHSHGSETFCVAPNGEDVQITAAGAEEDEAAEPGQSCHFHAGVEHCTGGATQSCERVQRDYNINLRVGLLFAMLVTSSIGVFTPILVASFISPSHAVFTVLRQFGTGVIISTAFVHLYTHATLMFQNECLGELQYEATSSAILMAGLFLSFLIEYAGNRLIQWHEAKAKAASVETTRTAEAAAPRTDMVNIAVLEAGVIFHSLLIGLTLVVAGDSFFLTLFAVIVFHQMFEGLALGTRIAALGRPCPTVTPAAAGHGHAHAHGHEHYHPANDTTPAGAATTTTEVTTESKPPAYASTSTITDTATPTPTGQTTTVSMRKKLLLALAFALVTPLGMAIGIGALQHFNGNDPATIIAIGTLDALSAGILVWVGVVEMWAHDWMLGGEMTRASPARTLLGLFALVVGMAVMSLLGKWA